MVTLRLPPLLEDTAVGVILLGVIVLGTPIGGNSWAFSKSNTGLSMYFNLCCPFEPPLSFCPICFPLPPERRLLDELLCDDELSQLESSKGLFLPFPLDWLSGVTKN